MICIKVCGITVLEDALAAHAAGADMLGLNFYPASPRAIAWPAAQTLTAALRAELSAACPLLVGVFVNESWETLTAVKMFVGLDLIQLSGDEPADLLARLGGSAVKAIRPRNIAEALRQSGEYAPHGPSDRRLPSLLLDAYHPALYGGTGEPANTRVALALRERVPRLMLAGGLTPDNVAGRVQAIRPWGVDVAGGVEGAMPGRKDAGKMRAFVQAARAASR